MKAADLRVVGLLTHVLKVNGVQAFVPGVV